MNNPIQHIKTKANKLLRTANRPIKTLHSLIDTSDNHTGELTPEILEKTTQLVKAHKKKDKEQVEHHLKALEKLERRRKVLESLTGRRNEHLYLMSSFLLHQAHDYLTSTPELGCYVTGIDLGNNTYCLTRIIPFKLSTHSTAYMKGDIRHTGDILTKLDKFEHQLLGWFHSHPGKGKTNTHHSPIDQRNQDRLERLGYRALGAVFVQDGYVRFFHHDTFKLEVYGKEVKKLEENLYRINPESLGEEILYGKLTTGPQAGRPGSG